jgi:hypothetical protein
LSVPENRAVVQMFLGERAPIPASRTSLYDPGCQIIAEPGRSALGGFGRFASAPLLESPPLPSTRRL